MMPIRRVNVIISNYSLYDVAHHFAEKLYEALCRAGLSCRLLHLKDFFQNFNEDPPDLTISFNCVPCDPRQRLLCDLTGIPHLVLMLDPPYHLRVKDASPIQGKIFSSRYIIISCDDKEGCDYLRSKKFNHTIFLPHAVEKELHEDPGSERIYDVVMLATFADFERTRREWRNKLSPAFRRTMEEVIECVFAEDEIGLTKAFPPIYQQLKEAGIFKDGQIPFPETYAALEQFIKAKDRIELVKSIRGAKVHIFGSSIHGSYNWESYFEGNHSNIVFHKEVDFPHALEIMKKTKILLNSGIKNKQGAHERIFSGIACGALVVTNENPYMRQWFQDGENILFYHPAKKEEINDKVMTYLKNEPLRQQVVRKGQQIVSMHHTWDQRVEELLRQVEPIYNKMKAL